MTSFLLGGGGGGGCMNSTDCMNSGFVRKFRLNGMLIQFLINSLVTFL